MAVCEFFFFFRLGVCFENGYKILRRHTDFYYHETFAQISADHVNCNFQHPLPGRLQTFF